MPRISGPLCKNSLANTPMLLKPPSLWKRIMATPRECTELIIIMKVKLNNGGWMLMRAPIWWNLMSTVSFSQDPWWSHSTNNNSFNTIWWVLTCHRLWLYYMNMDIYKYIWTSMFWFWTTALSIYCWINGDVNRKLRCSCICTDY